MTYDVTLVQVADRPHAGTGIFTPFPNPLCGFPADPFDFLLASMWVCLPDEGGGGASAGFELSPFAMSAISASDVVQVRLYDPTGALIYNASYDVPVVGVRSNVLLSVDSVALVVQVYVNDAPLSVTSGPGWTGSGPFEVGAGSRANLWIFSYAGVFTDPAAGDMWAAAPDDFFDLTNVANRRKFINANLTPVDLGVNGEIPLGFTPPIFLTVPSGGVPTDIQNNYGVGGAFSSVFGTPTISFQTPGVCTLPPDPTPGIPIPSCGALHTPVGFTAAWTPTGTAATSYTVDYRKLGDVSFTEITGITDLSVFIDSLDPDTTYEFKVKAINDAGESDFSDLVQCATEPAPVVRTVGSLRRTQLPEPPRPSQDIMKFQRDMIAWMWTVKARMETDSAVNTRPIGPLVVGTYTQVSTVTGTDDLSNFVATLVSLMQGHGYTVPFDLRTNT